MARNIGADGSTVYRAVIQKTYDDGRAWTAHEGPYTDPGPARARITFWRNRMRRNDGTATGHVEQAHTVWAPIGEQPDPIAAATAAAYRAAADEISEAEYLRSYTDDHMSDIYEAAEYLRRRAAEISPSTVEERQQ